ncbi:MAG: MBL fold metallo-hydrolase [Lachnospiraceae bacterium]|nr:MBL fold metallo-hydrolase [Lachnospiraceae bacterium]
MRFGSIASGSSGNSLYLNAGDASFLIDAGISCKRIVEGITGFGRYPSEIDAIFITHEHTDHISGLPVFMKKYHIPLYATEKTLDEILKAPGGSSIDPEDLYVIAPERPFTIKGVDITPYRISHDAADPVGYTFSYEGRKIGIATDIGVYDEQTVKSLQDCSLLYVEANHDLTMLQVGPYPYHLKRRIAGDRGHLSNENCAKLVCDVMNSDLRHVILGHLSKENNFPDVALSTVKCDICMKLGSSDLPFTLDVAPRSSMSALYTI